MRAGLERSVECARGEGAMVDTPERCAGLSEVSPASRFDRLCDDFEAAWEAGREPSLGDYLGVSSISRTAWTTVRFAIC